MSTGQSGLLDQILLEDIARHCPQQFLAFHQCMSKPSPDANLCGLEQYNLAGCIKKRCSGFPEDSRSLLWEIASIRGMFEDQWQ